MKTQQPVILNDNPGVALDSNYEYSGTIDKRGQEDKAGQTLLYPYCPRFPYEVRLVAIPLEQITAIYVADAFIKSFICILDPSRNMLTDQGSNHISSLMHKVAYRFGITRYKATVYRNRGIRSKDHILHYQSI